jgi:hypothetical protein
MIFWGRPPWPSLLLQHQHDASITTPFLHNGFQYVQKNPVTIWKIDLIAISSARGAAANATARSWVRAFTPRNHNMGTCKLICKIGRTRLRKSTLGSHLEAQQLGPPLQLRCLFSLSRNNRHKLRLRRLQQHHRRRVRKQMAGYGARREARAMNYQSALRHTICLLMTGFPIVATKGGNSVRFDPCP